MVTPTSLGNVGNSPNTSVDLRVGTAVALASVAKSILLYPMVLTNFFPGPIPQVSVYHHPHHRNGTGSSETTTKDSATLLNQEMSLTSGNQHQSSTAHQPSGSTSSHHSTLQSTTQVCLNLEHVIQCYV